MDDESVEPIQRFRRDRTTPLEHTIETVAPASRLRRDEADAILARLDRTREAIMRGRVFDDDSLEVLRQVREERTAQLEQAIEGEPRSDRRGRTPNDSGLVVDAPAFPEGAVTAPPGSAAAEPPRGNDEPIADYFERISWAMTGGRPLDDDSVDVLRQERDRRDEELDRRVRS